MAGNSGELGSAVMAGAGGEVRVNWWAAGWGVLLALGMVPWFSDASMEPRWTLVGLGAGLLALRGALPPVMLLGALGWGALSLLWATSWLWGVQVWIMLLALGLVAGKADEEFLEGALLGLALGLLAQFPLAVVQKLGYVTPWLPSSQGSGLFLSRNLTAELAAMVAVGMAGSKWNGRWLVVGALAVMIWMTTLRAAELGLALGLLVLWSRRLSPMAIVPVVMAVGVLSGDNDMASRGHFWLATLPGLRPWGAGLGQWAVGIGGQFLALHAHDDFLEVIYEQGLGALGLLAFFYLAITRGSREAPILASFATVAAFGFPWECPATAWLATVAAGSALHRAGLLGWPLDLGGRARGQGGASRGLRWNSGRWSVFSSFPRTRRTRDAGDVLAMGCSPAESDARTAASGFSGERSKEGTKARPEVHSAAGLGLSPQTIVRGVVACFWQKCPNQAT